MKTCNAFMKEGMTHFAKAMDHLSGVANSLDNPDDPSAGDTKSEDKDPDADDPDDDDATKTAKQLRRAAKRKAAHKV